MQKLDEVNSIYGRLENLINLPHERKEPEALHSLNLLRAQLEI